MSIETKIYLFAPVVYLLISITLLMIFVGPREVWGMLRPKKRVIDKLDPGEIIEDHWHEFEVDECDPYHERCTCGAVREVGGDFG